MPVMYRKPQENYLHWASFRFCVNCNITKINAVSRYTKDPQYARILMTCILLSLPDWAKWWLVIVSDARNQQPEAEEGGVEDLDSQCVYVLVHIFDHAHHETIINATLARAANLLGRGMQRSDSQNDDDHGPRMCAHTHKVWLSVHVFIAAHRVHGARNVHRSRHHQTTSTTRWRCNGRAQRVWTTCKRWSRVCMCVCLWEEVVCSINNAWGVRDNITWLAPMRPHADRRRDELAVRLRGVFYNICCNYLMKTMFCDPYTTHLYDEWGEALGVYAEVYRLRYNIKILY